MYSQHSRFNTYRMNITIIYENKTVRQKIDLFAFSLEQGHQSARNLYHLKALENSPLIVKLHFDKSQ